MGRYFKSLASLSVLLILLLPAVWSLFHPGFFVSDDGEWMIIRFSAFHQALVDGQFPVRWLGRLNHEYGYPVANFLYPGFMYLAEAPKALGFGFVDSIKIILLISIAGSAIFTYLWLKKLFNQTSAFFGVIFYLYAPYHLWDIYKRGSVGEVLALTIAPFILWAMEKKSIVSTSLGIGLLILSHNTLAILFLPLIFIYAILRKLITNYQLLITFFLGFGLSAFFWIPTIFDLKYTRFFQTQVSNWENYFIDFDLVGWGTLAILALTGFLLCFNDVNHFSKLSRLFFLTGILSIFLSLPFSSFIWRHLPVTFIQFPFRFLSLTILCTAFLTAFVADKMKGRLKIAILMILGIAVSVSAVSYLKPPAFFDKGEGFYATNEATTTVADEYMPIWVKKQVGERPKEKVKIISGEAEANYVFSNSKRISFEVKAKTDLEIQINTVYFPGWEVKVDDKMALIRYQNEEGVIRLVVKPGTHRVLVEFKETPLRAFSDIISLMSAGFVALLGIHELTRLRPANRRGFGGQARVSCK